MEKLTDDIIVRHKGREFVLSADSVIKKIGKYTYFLPKAGTDTIKASVKRAPNLENESD